MGLAGLDGTALLVQLHSGDRELSDFEVLKAASLDADPDENQQNGRHGDTAKPRCSPNSTALRKVLRNRGELRCRQLRALEGRVLALAKATTASPAPRRPRSPCSTAWSPSARSACARSMAIVT